MTPLPRYEVISRDIEQQIRLGTLKPGDRLPSETDLADRYQVSRMTVRQALDRLASARQIRRVKGSGTYAADSGMGVRRLARLAPFQVEMGLAPGDVTTEVALQTAGRPPAAARKALRLDDAAQAIRILRRRRIRSRPAAIQDSWLPYARVPSLVHEALVDGSLYRTLEAVYGITPDWAEQTISACPATDQQAEWLDVPIASPLIAIERLTFAQELEPIEWSQSVTRPDFPLMVQLSRG